MFIKKLTSLSLPTKVFLGTTLAYASYTTYIYTVTNYHIEIRENDYYTKLIKSNGNLTHTNDKSSQKCAGDRSVSPEEIIRDTKLQALLVNGRFENPFREYRQQTVFEFLAMRVIELFDWATTSGKKGGLPDSEEELRKNLPVFLPDLELLRNNHLGKETSIDDKHENNEGHWFWPLSSSSKSVLPELANRLCFTWFGQSCSLVQISNISFLLDPIFSDHLIDPTLGPKRITPSPVDLETLLNKVLVPEFIMVSHNHPDHLDAHSIKLIGNKSTWIVPAGMRHYLAKKGIYNTIEMNWWDRVEIEVPQLSSSFDVEKNETLVDSKTKDKYEVVCVPAMHWSGRHVTDTNKSLWCSFIILKNGHSVFFHCGDTGYSNELFKTIGHLYSPIKFAALPIGQYCPQWHQKPRHINPTEAVDIMEDLKVHKMVGVHWGTFVLSSETYLEPKLMLEKLAKVHKKLNGIMTPQFGQTIVMDMSKMDYERDDDVEVIRNGKCLVHR
ncbi:unnamed protein product [Ambrosiozyma monospora]|uniref:Unnamed protein product n=1 Tax=Ambrosiozyma monospora TaxID=43982 RepID=A0ACB5SZT8_AMBMO|nr:unnamed protein product [Ambrosiozyma monospora]